MQALQQRPGVAFVTGAGGFLGGAVAEGLRRAGWRVVGLGHPTRHSGDSAGTPFVDGDIDRASLTRALAPFGAPQLVFHAAGGASVGASINDPAQDRDRTIGSLAPVLDFLQSEAPDARLIYPSSAAVYGDAGDGPIGEGAAPAPASPYGRHKLEAERLILAEHAERGLDAVIVRFFSAYGPGLRKQLLWELAGRLAAGPAAVDLGGTGEEARDFLFVDDAVELVLRLAASEQAPLIVNGGAGEAVTVRRMAETVRDAMGSAASIRFSGKAREGDPRSLVADPGLSAALGFRPAVSLAEGVQRFARWVRSGT